MRATHRHRLLDAATALAVVATACVGHVRSDIDSINSELTGPYAVRHIAEEDHGKTFVADVCVARDTRRSLVAEEIVDQRLSHGNDAVIVNLYSDDGREGERVTWTRSGGTTTTPLGASSICSTK